MQLENYKYASAQDVSHISLWMGESASGLDRGRDRSNYSSFVIFVFIDVLTEFCVLKFMLAVPPAFAFPLNWTAERVISVDFR